MAKLTIEELLDPVNICNLIDDDTLDKMGQRIVDDFEMDYETGADRREKDKQYTELAMQVVQYKNFPFEGAANVKFPLLTQAAVQFNSRVLGNLIQGNRVVKARPIGADPDGQKATRAERISQHMSWQLLEQMEEWVDDLDKATVMLPIVGCVFRKTYYDTQKKRNVSVLVPSDKLIIHYWAKSLETAARITHLFELAPNVIEERKRAEIFRDVDLTLKGTPTGDDEKGPEMDDEDAPHEFLEQHRWWDLDGDGYQEPYIVTVHKPTAKVVRVIARFDVEGVKLDKSGKKIERIEPIHYFTKIPFFPAPDGSIYDVGFGQLIGPINETINTALNQLLDAGTLANSNSGFVGREFIPNRGRGAGMIRLKLGEWMPVNFSGDDLRKAFVPLPVHEPSPTLFQLLALMVDAGKETMSVTEVMTGEQSNQNEPATTYLARIEQGMQVFSAIYARIHRALKKEYKKLFRLNSLYMEDEEYYTVMDIQEAIPRADYNINDYDVAPVSDPKNISETQKLVKAGALMQLRGQGMNDQEINRRYLEALGIEDVQRLLEVPQQGPPPELLMEQEKLALERAKFELDMLKSKYELVKVQAETMLALAKAEAQEAGPQLEIYKAELNALMAQTKASATGSQNGQQGNEG